MAASPSPFAAAPQQPRLLDRYRQALQMRGRPPEQVEAWMRRVTGFIRLHGLRGLPAGQLEEKKGQRAM
jgi:hypothetical protein